MTDTTEQRREFEAWAKTKHLDIAQCQDAWGNDIYTHSYVDAMWFGWQAATARAARKPLTTDQLFANDDLMALNAVHGMQMFDIAKIVRVIEAAHGIEAAPPVGKGGE